MGKRRFSARLVLSYPVLSCPILSYSALTHHDNTYQRRPCVLLTASGLLRETTQERANTTIIMRTQGIAGAMMLFLAATIVSVSGVFIAGGWSDIEITNPEFEDIYKFAVDELPELYANNMFQNMTLSELMNGNWVQNMTQPNNETLEICSAQEQVVAGMNFFLSFSPNCTDSNIIRQNVTIFRSLDGLYNITDFTDFTNSTDLTDYTDFILND